MNKFKSFALTLVLIGGSLVPNAEVFAADLHDMEIAAMSKADYIAYRDAKGEEQRALALSSLPEVVGEDLLEEEADGRYMMPQQALDKWANGRMFPPRPFVENK